MRAKRLLLLIAVFLWAGFSRAAFAHPMGNFSVNHYSKIDLASGRVVVTYFIDLAEIPTFQELQQGNITANVNSPVVTRFVATRGEELGRGLSLIIDGRLLSLRMTSSGVIFPPGAGGLPTMKMGFTYDALLPRDLDRSRLDLHFADNNYEGHSGWKEIVAVASGGTMIKSSVPAQDRSAGLSNYPTDLLNSPPQDLEASMQASLRVVASPGSSAQAAVDGVVQTHSAKTAIKSAAATHIGSSSTPAAAPRSRVVPSNRAIRSATASAPSLAAPTSIELKGNRQKTPRSRFTELISAQHLSLWFLFTAAIIAAGLGALHALEPGHGKTIVAAYLVGSRGTARHAFLLGLIVTASHTAGVFALGAITLYASHYIVPEQLYPWLGVLSGITIAALGCYMLLRRLTGTASDHSHAPGSSHSHWPFGKRAANEGAQQDLAPVEESAARRVSLAQLFTLGITGGIIPCPAALIVLLSAFALHRIALGFFLIVAFSFGLAAILIAFGMLMVYAGRFVSRFQIDGPLTRRWLPAASSAFIAILGIVLAIQALGATHIGAMHVSLVSIAKDRLGTFLFVVGLGLILGMRHSTDADHVVAISTIVSKQKGIRNAALIGSVWGLGHTVTIFAVGALIILFGVEIPPRVGLSMEFCVAIMLVLLGVLNLTGVMQRITVFFAPRSEPDTVRQPRKSLGIDRMFAGPVEQLGRYQLIRPLVIGLVHGLAGSAAVALLVLSTIHDPVWATAYLLIFGGGTMAGMMLMTAAISVPLSVAGNRSAKLGRYFGVASGMVSLCFGSFLVYQLGFLGGLFTAHPHWTPQ
jgi:ABC-type nickel/cobalt efflux system permease component RcnA